MFVGDLAELLLYNRALPEAERQGVEQYLHEKWLSGQAPPAPLNLVAAPAESPAAEAVASKAIRENPAGPPPADLAGGELAPTGQIQREVWRNFRGIDLDAFNDLLAARPMPDLSETLERLEAPADFDDSYGQRIRGFLQPPLTGDYTFTVRANEGGVLLISSDESSENKRPVTEKAKVHLTAGRAYYVEGIHWEKGGKDSFVVGWKLPDGSEENPIPGHRLSLRAGRSRRMRQASWP